MASNEQRLEQRRNIQRAAASIYNENGLAGISVRAVAERAGVSAGKLYSYFDNLGELLRSLWLNTVNEANNQLETVAVAHDDPIARIDALLRSYLEFALTNPEVYRSTLMFVRPTNAAQPERVPLDSLPLHRLLSKALKEADAAGVASIDDPSQRAQLLWASVHGAIALPINIDTYALDPSGQLATAMIDQLMASLQTTKA